MARAVTRRAVRLAADDLGHKTLMFLDAGEQEALELTMDSMKKHKIPPPKPKARFSGQFNVRVPKGLHRELVRKAEEEGVSLNALVTYLLSQSVKIKKAA